MKKTTILIIVVLFMVIGYAAYNTTINIYGNGKLAENLSDFKVYLSNLKVNGKEISGINNTKDEFTINDVNGTLEYEITNDSTEYDADVYIECEGESIGNQTIWNYDYSGGEQSFTSLEQGKYKIEVWGAQGGTIAKSTNLNSLYGGYGAYASGVLEMDKGEKLYINVGGQGTACLKYGTSTSGSATCGSDGGYNGGGSTRQFIQKTYYGSGGGSTSISLKNGTLANLSTNISNILIVAGGGGGASSYIPSKVQYASNGGSAGGYIGSVSTSIELDRTTVCLGGTQTSGGTGDGGTGAFGIGASVSSYVGPGGGSGFYGGGTSETKSCGGSSYIGNSRLLDKVMYCHNCAESNDSEIKTISTTCVSITPTENCAKQGNGYVRITKELQTNKIVSQQVNVSAQHNLNQSINNIKSQSITCKLRLNKVSRLKKENLVNVKEWNYDYTGGEQTFVVPVTGTYKLETWGAQGGTIEKNLYLGALAGGYGAYSSGLISLTAGTTIFINVGGVGSVCTKYSTAFLNSTCGNDGGYNGGGSTRQYFSNTYYGSGGGATHIATRSGLLSFLYDNIDSILMVSGGGGGASSYIPSQVQYASNGGNAGGIVGSASERLIYDRNTDCAGGTQASGGTGTDNFGFFGNGASLIGYVGPGGGSGFYGGGTSETKSCGGSGYIGNSLLSNKAMYCYNCQESKDISTKTISTTCTSSTPTANCSKQGNGYARITLVNVS